MFINIIVLLTIMAYMFDGKLGFFLFLFALVLIMSQKKNMYYKLFHLWIASLPFSFIGVFGMDMSHNIWNWTTIFLFMTVIYVIYMSHGRLWIDKKVFNVAMLLIASLIITCVLTIESVKSIVEIVQISMMLFTILFVWCNRTNIAIDADCAIGLINEFGNICFITAISTIIQWIVYRSTGIQLGYIVLTANGMRVICNCLYKGMSVLSVFLGTGAIFVLLGFGIDTAKVIDTVKIGIILAGIVVNTSRTGLAGFAIVFAIYLATGLIKKKKAGFLLFGALGLVGIILAGYRLAAVRGNLFDENGRIATWRAGIMIWNQSIRNILFGAGFENSIWANRGGMTSHNMLIQSLAQCGVIGTFWFLLLFIMYYKKIKNTPLIYVLLYLIITGMLMTDFYANPFTTLAMSLIVIACGAGPDDVKNSCKVK